MKNDSRIGWTLAIPTKACTLSHPAFLSSPTGGRFLQKCSEWRFKLLPLPKLMTSLTLYPLNPPRHEQQRHHQSQKANLPFPPPKQLHHHDAPPPSPVMGWAVFFEVDGFGLVRSNHAEMSVRGIVMDQ